MGNRRQAALTRSIQSALFRDADTFKKSVIGQMLAFFSIFYIRLLRHETNLFKHLRNETFKIDDLEYERSFQSSDRTQPPLQPMGDLGYSGSTFLRTSNGKYIIKSLPRHFEHSFFRRDLLGPYCDHMAQHPASLLSWITDYIYAPYVTLGSLCNVTPAHHIIMTNALSDCDQGPARKQQETYDLKPIDYFYPELDLFPDPLVGKNVMDKLADVFEDKIRVSGTDYQELRKELDADTWFLKQVNAVDYSLFLIRGPAESGSGDTTGGKHGRGSGRASRWREGVRSVDGNWWYRVVVLDFFWAKHTLRAQAMTGAVQMFNVIAHKEPMTITTTAWEYREKFLHMVDSLVEVHEA